eukprot:10913146-Alexandrium_andersonii.AAC.1
MTCPVLLAPEDPEAQLAVQELGADLVRSLAEELPPFARGMHEAEPRLQNLEDLPGLGVEGLADLRSRVQ